ncbi:hypothetical protein OF83DRAFT_138768 [Amylostereum chailletii]|nr:hypothetical protein OF83DRAFT_138768 [Amylostereum chailletii]
MSFNNSNNVNSANASSNINQTTTRGYSNSIHGWNLPNGEQTAGPSTLFAPGGQEMKPFQHASMPPPPAVHPSAGQQVHEQPPFASYGYNDLYNVSRLPKHHAAVIHA